MKTGTYKILNLHETSLIEVNEFKKSLIVWCQNQATGKRTQAAIAERKRTTDEMNAKAESYDFVAAYLQGLEIVGS